MGIFGHAEASGICRFSACEIGSQRHEIGMD